MRKTRATSSTASSSLTAKRRPSSASTVSPDHTLLVRKSSAPPTLPSRPSSSKYLVGQPSYRSLQEQFATLTRTNKATEEGARAALDRIAELERENFSLTERVATLEDWNATQAHTSAEAAVASESALARCQAENVLLAKLAAAPTSTSPRRAAARRRARGGGGGGAARGGGGDGGGRAAERGGGGGGGEPRGGAREGRAPAHHQATERIEDETALQQQLPSRKRRMRRAAAAADHHRLLLQGVRRDAEEAVKARRAPRRGGGPAACRGGGGARGAAPHAHDATARGRAEAEERWPAHDGSRLKEAYEEARELSAARASPRARLRPPR